MDISIPGFFHGSSVTFGNVARILEMRGPGLAQWDMSLSKNIPNPTRRLELRSSVLKQLNAFNTPVFRRSQQCLSAPLPSGRITSQGKHRKTSSACAKTHLGKQVTILGGWSARYAVIRSVDLQFALATPTKARLSGSSVNNADQCWSL
jgi:hypothetical protein